MTSGGSRNGEGSMSDAEHLIENMIIAIKNNRADEELEWASTQEMLKHTGINPGDLYAMAMHVVYGLYEGQFPPDI